MWYLPVFTLKKLHWNEKQEFLSVFADIAHEGKERLRHSSVLNLLMLPNILSNITWLIRDFRLHFIITEMIHFTKLFYHMQQKEETKGGGGGPWTNQFVFFQGVCLILLLYKNKQTEAYVCQFCHGHLQCFCLQLGVSHTRCICESPCSKLLILPHISTFIVLFTLSVV